MTTTSRAGLTHERSRRNGRGGVLNRELPQDPITPMWRGVVLLRALTMLFAIGVVIAHWDGYALRWMAVVVLCTMAAWTAVASYYYLRDRHRFAVCVADLVVSCGLMVSSRLVLTDEQLTVNGVPLITTVWVTGAVAAAALQGGSTVGGIFGAVLGLFNYGVRGYVDTDLTRDMVLLVGVGIILGLAATASRTAMARLAQALQAEAATAERERLARSIHDGVLQVLARVRKRGAEIGGEAAELARLAGTQEIALRSLVSTGAPASTVDGTVDLGPRLRMLAAERKQVSVPATPVPLPGTLAEEVIALVREALANVDRHAGPGARAWVLLEDLGGEVVVSVRDDGVGIPPGRLEAAEAEGRMGVARSIRGRVRDLGGTITVETAPDAGTEWEVRVPRPAKANGDGRS